MRRRTRSHSKSLLVISNVSPHLLLSTSLDHFSSLPSHTIDVSCALQRLTTSLKTSVCIGLGRQARGPVSRRTSAATRTRSTRTPLASRFRPVTTFRCVVCLCCHSDNMSLRCAGGVGVPASEEQRQQVLADDATYDEIDFDNVVFLFRY